VGLEGNADKEQHEQGKQGKRMWGTQKNLKEKQKQYN